MQGNVIYEFVRYCNDIDVLLVSKSRGDNIYRASADSTRAGGVRAR